MFYGVQYIFLNIILCVFASESRGNMHLVSLHHEQTPRLEDFFWTGSGDGPPPPPDSATTPDEPSTPLIRTTTVLATVYLDSYPPQAVTDKATGECILNCGEPTAPGSLESEVPDDRRYWLLTVIQGSTPDSLQLRLARLYQKAFLRQQERHLGIIKSLDSPPARKKHEVHSFVVNKDNSVNQIVPYSSNTDTPLKYLEIEGSISNINDILPTSTMILENNTAETVAMNVSITKSLEFYPANMELLSSEIDFSKSAEIEATKINDVATETWVLVTPTSALSKREVSDGEMAKESSGKLIDIPLEEDVSNETMLFKREIIKPEQQPPVQVHIQNITESPETGSVQIVYVVMVGGRAVPAAVAARDMRLVRDAEVAKELGAVVTTKAEPAYLKAAEGLEGAAIHGGVSGTELWALAVGGTVAVLVLIVLIVLLCLAHRRKTLKSATSLRAYRDELMREIERNQLKQVHEEKDGRLISVVSPSRTRPSSTLLTIYRAASATGSRSSASSSDVAEIATSARRRQKKPHALRMPQKKRVGTTDSLLEAAGVESSDSGQRSAPQTPTSFLSMPSVNSFPRGNTVEPLSRILEPVSVRHLDIDSPISTPRGKAHASKVGQPPQDTVPRRQMASQLVRLGSLDKDPGVIGPLVWDLHCQRIKDNPSKPTTPISTTTTLQKEPSRMRQRFNELMDDAFTLFGSAGSSPGTPDTYTVKKDPPVTQARNDNVRLPGSPYSALDTVRGKSAVDRRETPAADVGRPRTSVSKPAAQRQPASAWGVTPPPSLARSRLPVPALNPAHIMPAARLPPDDPALPLIAAIKTEIQRVRDNATKPSY